jgi:hypothetical protein
MKKLIGLATTLAERDRRILKIFDLKNSPGAQVSLAFFPVQCLPLRIWFLT